MDETQKTELDQIDIVEGGSNFDATVYKGFKTKIADVRIDKEAINYYNGPSGSDGRPTYNPESTETMWKAIVETETLPVLDELGNPTNEKLVLGTNEDGTPKHVTVSARFNFTNKDGHWVISKAPSAKLWKFMRKQGVTKLSELIGTIVVLDVEPGNDDRMWLRISI